MAATPEKPSSDELRNPGITKKVAVKRTRTSPVKVFLRTTYWLISIAVVCVVLYISFEVGMTIYSNAKQ